MNYSKSTIPVGLVSGHKFIIHFVFSVELRGCDSRAVSACIRSGSMQHLSKESSNDDYENPFSILHYAVITV